MLYNKEIVHEVIKSEETIEYEVKLLGGYYPRWYPDRLDVINYYSETPIPKLEVVRQRKSKGNESDSRDLYSWLESHSGLSYPYLAPAFSNMTSKSTDMGSNSSSSKS